MEVFKEEKEDTMGGGEEKEIPPHKSLQASNL